MARFEAERQALAVMTHDSIAKVLDAGASATGSPYFVMELVRGVPITDYCDTRKLATRDRVALFIPVCRAIQHAHQKGVIHRDLKPSNILVTEADGRPVPKVIDFGIAKATGQRLTEKTLITQFGQAVGTPAYMSPEQAEMSGLDVDTRTDVYSLGVVLYEILVGRLPLDPQELGLPGFMARLAMRETDPPTPSAKLATLARRPRGPGPAPPHRSRGPAPPAPRRPRLDHDEGDGEGPRPALRHGERPGQRPGALSRRPAGRGASSRARRTGCGSSSGGTRWASRRSPR